MYICITMRLVPKTKSQKYLNNDASSFCYKTGEVESVTVKSIDTVLSNLSIQRVDLIKMNVEGYEYDILEKMIDLDLLKLFDHFQIQFHWENFPRHDEKRNNITKHLAKTHKCVWNYEFVWESWSKKEL